MKILFIGDYSGLHACMARGLRDRGHQVTLISDRGGFMNTDCDITLQRRPGKLGGAMYFAQMLRLLPSLRGYDVVHLINPHFLDIRPEKIKFFFDRIKRQNGLMLLTLSSFDYHYCQACIKGEIFRYSEFYVGNTPTPFEASTHHAQAWTTPEMEEFNRHIYSNIDGAVSILPEYDMAARPILGSRLAFINLPIDLSTLPYQPYTQKKKINLFIGVKEQMQLQKGTDQLYRTLLALQQRHPDRCTVTRVSNLPLNQYLVTMQRADIVIDQLYSYSPATNALQAMALGKVAAVGAMPEYYHYLDRADSVANSDTAANSDIYSIHPSPIINLTPLTDPAGQLEQYILDPTPLAAMSRAGRLLVEKHNALPVVIDRLQAHWKSL